MSVGKRAHRARPWRGGVGVAHPAHRAQPARRVDRTELRQESVKGRIARRRKGPRIRPWAFSRGKRPQGAGNRGGKPTAARHPRTPANRADSDAAAHDRKSWCPPFESGSRRPSDETLDIGTVCAARLVIGEGRYGRKRVRVPIEDSPNSSSGPSWARPRVPAVQLANALANTLAPPDSRREFRLCTDDRDSSNPGVSPHPPRTPPFRRKEERTSDRTARRREVDAHGQRQSVRSPLLSRMQERHALRSAAARACSSSPARAAVARSRARSSTTGRALRGSEPW